MQESSIRTSKEVDEFPLLRLPLVAREHVLCMMTPFELINVSMTSSKARQAVTFFSRIKSRFWVGIGIREYPFIDIKESEEFGMAWCYLWTSDPSKIGLTTDSFSYECIHLFSESKMDDCMKWYESIKGVLGCRIGRACVDNLNASIGAWLQSQQDSIEDITILKANGEDVKYFLKTMRVSGNLSLTMSPTNFELEIPESLTSLSISTAKFINFDQLLRLKAQFIDLEESILTNQEINRFLKSWMLCESHLDLKSFKINISGEEAVNEIMDLPHEVATNGYKIKRSDGKRANIEFYLWKKPYLCLLIY
uniref:F-box domain-containing protein n=1 Tax=Caenorhabditis tropicalis TaxID=1561998 RepID=A0A1I7TUM0_9PELO